MRSEGFAHAAYPEEKKELGKLKDRISRGRPYDSNHPGIDNLTENEKDKLKAMEEKEPEDLTPREKALDDKLKNIMATGLPINKEHPGIPNLSPPEAEKFDAFERQK